MKKELKLAERRARMITVMRAVYVVSWAFQLNE